MKYVIYIGLVFLLVLILFACQHGLIYYPRRYHHEKLPSQNIVELDFHTSEGLQFSYFYPAKDSETKVPPRLWLLFGGNAALALDWHDFVRHHPDGYAAFLLIDYPGYGKCEGKASAKKILEATNKAVESLAKHLSIEKVEIEQRISVLGHSLGAAAALQYSVSVPVKKVILVSPFTSLSDMAALVVGKPLHLLLLDHYDNKARLKELAEMEKPPIVFILHGKNDEVIPVRMSRELAKINPDLVVYQESPRARHNDILSIEEQRLYETMMPGPIFP